MTGLTSAIDANTIIQNGQTIVVLHNLGYMTDAQYQALIASNTDQLVGGGTGGNNGGGNNGNNNGNNGPAITPFGAFYETTSTGPNTAPAIDNRLGKLVTVTGAAWTATQLAALDTNLDGRLSGAELSALQTQSDLDEDGIAGAGEITSLNQYLLNQGLSQAQASNWLATIGIRAEDYGLYTQGALLMTAAYAAQPVVDGTAQITAQALPTQQTMRVGCRERSAAKRNVESRHLTLIGLRLRANRFGLPAASPLGDWLTGHEALDAANDGAYQRAA